MSRVWLVEDYYKLCDYSVVDIVEMSYSSNQRRGDISDSARETLYQSIRIADETERIGDATINTLQAQGETLSEAVEEVRIGVYAEL